MGPGAALTVQKMTAKSTLCLHDIGIDLAYCVLAEAVRHLRLQVATKYSGGRFIKAVSPLVFYKNTTLQKRISRLPNLLIYMLTLVFAAGLKRILDDLYHLHRGLSPSFPHMCFSISAHM